MRQPFGPGENPRTLRGHRERGPVRFAYTVKSIADAAWVSVPTVRRALRGKYGDLAAVAAFIVASRQRRIVTMADERQGG